MERCALCGSADGEASQVGVVRLGRYRVCNVCRHELERLRRVFRADFNYNLRGEVEVLDVIPYPAFYGVTTFGGAPRFNFPPHAEMYRGSGYHIGPHAYSFAVGITDRHIVGGARSAHSNLAEAEWELDRVLMRLNEVDEEEARLLEHHRRRLEHRIASLTARGKYRTMVNLGGNGTDHGFKGVPLFFICYEQMEAPRVTEDKEGVWIDVRIPYGDFRTTFLLNKRRRRGEVRWRLSREFLPQIEMIRDMVGNGGGR